MSIKEILRCLQQLACEMQTCDVYYWQITANASVICCLHSLFQFEVSENKGNFCLSKFKVSSSLTNSGFRSIGLWLRASVLGDCIASHRLALASFRMTFLPIQFPSLVLVIGCSQSPGFWLGKAESSQPICPALIIVMLWVHGTTSALLKFIKILSTQAAPRLYRILSL